MVGREIYPTGGRQESGIREQQSAEKKETTKYRPLSTTFVSSLPTKTYQPDLLKRLSSTVSTIINDGLIHTELLACLPSLPVVEPIKETLHSSFHLGAS